MTARILLAAVALAVPVAVTGCGSDSLNDARDRVQQLEDDAQQTLDDLSADGARQRIEDELDDIKTQLEDSSVPDEARQTLQDTRDKLQRALDELKR